MKINMQKFLSRLKELQGDKSVAAFARCLGIRQNTFDLYIKGLRKPSVDLVFSIIYNCGVSFEWLFGLSDVRTPAKAAAPSPAAAPSAADLAAAKRSKNSPGAKYPDPNAALLAEVRELTARVKALEAAAAHPAFACG